MVKGRAKRSDWDFSVFCLTYVSTIFVGQHLLLLLLLQQLFRVIIEEWKLDKPLPYWKPMQPNIFWPLNGRNTIAKNKQTRK